MQHTLADQVTPLRLAGHISVLMIAAVVLVLSQIKIPEWEISKEPTPAPVAGAATALGIAQTSSAAFDPASLRPNIVLNFVDKKVQQDAPRQDIAYYTVKSGDTVLAIAGKFGLQPETLMWSNSNIADNPDRLSIGDELRILPVDGVLHVVKPGETLSNLADEYDVTMDAVVGYAGNNLPDVSATLSVGRELVIPGGTRPFAATVAGAPGAYWVDTPPMRPRDRAISGGPRPAT